MRGFLALCLLGVVTSSLAKALGEKPEKFKNEEGCYVEDLGEVIPYGEAKVSPTQCLEYRCEEVSVTIAGCEGIDWEHPTEVEETNQNPSEYPDCCAFQGVSTDQHQENFDDK